MLFAHLTTVVFFLLQACLINFGSSLSKTEIRDILLIHNFYRHDAASEYLVSNMNKLIWSDRLAVEAGEVLISLANNRFNPGDSPDERNYNFGWTSRTAGKMMDFRTIMATWWNEGRHFFPDARGCNPSCDNFRNMFNANQQSIGCADLDWLTRVDNKIIFVCKYQGSIYPSIFDYKNGSVCTGCQHPKSFCQDSLCVSCDPSIEQCEASPGFDARCSKLRLNEIVEQDCRKTCTNNPGVGAGHLDRNTCTCNCTSGTGLNCDKPCVDEQVFENIDYCGSLTPSECLLLIELRESCPRSCGFCNVPPANHSSTD